MGSICTFKATPFYPIQQNVFYCSSYQREIIQKLERNSFALRRIDPLARGAFPAKWNSYVPLISSFLLESPEFWWMRFLRPELDRETW